MFLYMAIIYWIIRRFGQDAQAGFGIGMRINQSLFLPAMAVAFATAPIVGQNFAAGKFDRVRETFLRAAIIGAVSVATRFLEVVSWNFVASGLVFTCSAVFQGLGHTMPAVVSSATRIVSFVVPALWLDAQPNFQIVQVWYFSVASMTLQLLVSAWLLRREFRVRLIPSGAATH